MGCSGSNVRGGTNESKKPPVSETVENKEDLAKKNPPSSGIDEVKVKGAVNFYSGILADNSSFLGEKLYNSQDQVNEFKNSIANQKVEYTDKGIGVKPGVKYVKNDTDPFLNGEVKVDFSKQRLIVCQGSRLSSIEEKNGKISVEFDNVTMVRGNYYYAYVINSKLNELDLGENRAEMFDEQRPYNDNMIIEQRPINNRIIEQRPINNRIIVQKHINNNIVIEQRPINDNMIIEQRPINDNMIIEQKPINEEFCEEPVEYADNNNNYNDGYNNEEYAEGEEEYEEA